LLACIPLRIRDEKGKDRKGMDNTPHTRITHMRSRQDTPAWIRIRKEDNTDMNGSCVSMRIATHAPRYGHWYRRHEGAWMSGCMHEKDIYYDRETQSARRIGRVKCMHASTHADAPPMTLAYSRPVGSHGRNHHLTHAVITHSLTHSHHGVIHHNSNSQGMRPTFTTHFCPSLHHH